MAAKENTPPVSNYLAKAKNLLVTLQHNTL
jgi:hypothetical protein